MTSFIGRERETEALRDVLESAGPSLSVVRGLPGMGTTATVGRVLSRLASRERQILRFTAPLLPSPDLRALLAARIEGLPGAGPLPPGAGWRETLAALARGAPEERIPRVVVVDDAHHLLDAHGGFTTDLLGLWSELRTHALPVHLVLAGRDPALGGFVRGAREVSGAVGLDLVLPPLDVTEVASALPSYGPDDRLRSWAVFGGAPDRVRRIDPGVTLATNVRRLLLSADAPLLREGQELLSREVQSPARYGSLVRGLALGAGDWGELRRACPDVASGSQMAPYLSRLEEAGWVETRRSLDAGPRSRRRHYELTDPFVGFWFRFVLPRLADVAFGATGSAGREGRGPDPWSAVTAGGPGGLEAHVALHLPRALRGWALRHAGTRFGAPAREAGGLWGDGYDLPLAGTLRTGGVFYGHIHWPGSPVGDPAVDAVEAELRSTRYGFGKERRLRVVFSGGGVAPEGARRAARDDRVVLLETKDLTGA